MSLKIDNVCSEYGVSKAFIEANAELTTPRRFRAIKGLIDGKKSRQIAAEMGVAITHVAVLVRNGMSDFRRGGSYDYRRRADAALCVDGQIGSSCI